MIYYQFKLLGLKKIQIKNVGSDIGSLIATKISLNQIKKLRIKFFNKENYPHLKLNLQL